MIRREHALRAVLVVSLLANGPLLHHRLGAPATTAASAPGPTPSPPHAPPSARAAGQPAPRPIQLACDQRLAIERSRMDELRRRILLSVENVGRFHRGEPNQRLTEQFRASVTKLVAARPDAVLRNLECRGQVCEIDADQSYLTDYLAKSLPDPWHRQNVVRTQVVGYKVYQRVRGHEPAGEDVLMGLMEGFKKSGFARTCAQHQKAGELIVELELVPPDVSGEPDSIVNVSYAGSVAGTEFGNCIAEQLSVWISNHRPPADATFGKTAVSLFFRS